VPDTRDLFKPEQFYPCLQCAICTGSCPAAQVVDKYNPRELILRSMLDGELDKVLETDMVWCCTTCQVCRERCPHGIDVAGLLTHLTNQAAARGNIPKALRGSVMSMIETGRPIPTNSRTERVRKELGLEPLQEPETEEIRQVLLDAGLGEILDIK